MSEEEFQFKETADMNAIVKQIGKSLAGTVGTKPENTICKGIRIYYVDTESGMLMQSGLFVKGFNPDDWDDEP